MGGCVKGWDRGSVSVVVRRGMGREDGRESHSLY